MKCDKSGASESFQMVVGLHDMYACAFVVPGDASVLSLARREAELPLHQFSSREAAAVVAGPGGHW
jgi:hypothetical protein